MFQSMAWICPSVSSGTGVSIQVYPRRVQLGPVRTFLQANLNEARAGRWSVVMLNRFGLSSSSERKTANLRRIKTFQTTVWQTFKKRSTYDCDGQVCRYFWPLIVSQFGYSGMDCGLSKICFVFHLGLEIE